MAFLLARVGHCRGAERERQYNQRHRATQLEKPQFAPSSVPYIHAATTQGSASRTRRQGIPRDILSAIVTLRIVIYPDGLRCEETIE